MKLDDVIRNRAKEQTTCPLEPKTVTFVHLRAAKCTLAIRLNARPVAAHCPADATRAPLSLSGLPRVQLRVLPAPQQRPLRRI